MPVERDVAGGRDRTTLVAVVAALAGDVVVGAGVDTPQAGTDETDGQQDAHAFHDGSFAGWQGAASPAASPPYLRRALNVSRNRDRPSAVRPPSLPDGGHPGGLQRLTDLHPRHAFPHHIACADPQRGAVQVDQGATLWIVGILLATATAIVATIAQVGWLLGRGIAAPQASSLLQGSARFNTFIGLAIAEAVFGTQGLQIAVLGSALLVPVVNVTVVTLMTRQLGGGGKSILIGLVKNPLILSICAGVLFNLAGLNEVPVLHEIARILGSAALPIMLLCVGANLKIRGLSGSARIIGVSMIGKFLINPAAVLLAAILLGADPLTVQVALIFAALPTGAASYTLAREMRGDAPLMAAIITAQTLISFVTLPLTLLIGAAIVSG